MNDSVSSRSIGRNDDEVAAALHSVQNDIEKFGQRDVKIVAVTKGFDRSAIDCAARIGMGNIGENYAQELREKLPVPDGVQTHFIGRIQRNKVRKIADSVDLWHSVSRPEVLVEISKRSSQRARVLIQVVAAGDPTKDGIEPQELESMLEVAREHGVEVAGLMTIGVLGDPTRSRDSFVETARLADEFGLVERSMGMSGDYRDALAAGSSILRLGSLLFGARPAR